MDRWGEDPPTGQKPGARPRFCPRCRRADREGGTTLCAECGETLLPQGYCSTCEDYWPLAAGIPCPKHEVALEEGAPRRAVLPTGQNSPVPRWVTVGTF